MGDPPAGDRRYNVRWWIAAVALVAVAASLAGLRNGFAQDDLVLIAQNSRIHALANWRELLTSPYWPPPYSQDLYRPLSSLLLAVEWAVGGGNPLLFRIISYLCYAGTAVAVLLLSRRLLPGGVAVFVACLFAAHPVHVEAAALGVAQNELLVGLGAVLLVLRYLDRRRGPNGTLRGRDWAFLGGLYVAASLLKEHGLILPGLLLAAECVLLSGPLKPRLRMLGPGFAVLAGLAIGVLLIRRLIFPENLAGSFVADALQGQTALGRLFTMLQVVPHWARLLLWPRHLQADYSPRELVAAEGFGWSQLLDVAVLASVVAIAWLARRRAPVVTFGLAWTAIALVPVSNIAVPTGILLAERTLFLPSIGFVLALGGLLATLPLERVLARRGWRVALAVAGGALVLAGTVRSSRRHAVWQSDDRYALETARDAPRSWRAQKAAGYALFEAERPEEAIEAYQKALELAPRQDVWQVRNDLARRLFRVGENALAAEQLRLSLETSPGLEETRNYLVLALLALGDYTKAAAEADSALIRGHSRELFEGLRSLADSAARVGAPPGSIRIRIITGAGPVPGSPP